MKENDIVLINGEKRIIISYWGKQKLEGKEWEDQYFCVKLTKSGKPDERTLFCDLKVRLRNIFGVNSMTLVKEQGETP